MLSNASSLPGRDRRARRQGILMELRDAGDPVESPRYNEQGADELLLLDITAIAMAAT